MKTVNCILALCACGLWYYAMEHAFEVKGNNLPAIGNFIAPGTGIWYTARNAEVGSKELDIADEKYKGQVIFDDRMVPHIQADNMDAAAFMQGYAQAVLRLWQMDFSTRATEGRVSEIVGDRAIAFDKRKRRLGHAESAKQITEYWKQFPEPYSIIEAYAAGVNSYIQSLSYKDFPIEYKLMGFAPELWSPYKSALFYKGMAETLCSRDKDIELTNTQNAYGPQLLKTMFPEVGDHWDPVIPKGTKWNIPDSITKTLTETPFYNTQSWSITREPKPKGLGSNNWAVAASKALNANPILCNDPHLLLTLPSIWCENHIITKDINCYGVNFPGIPGIIIGFNKDIAWGVTNAGWDVMDWYEIQFKNNQKKEYMLDGKWQSTQYRYDTIKIKNKASVIDTVLMTNWGPVIYLDSLRKDKGLAMHWISNKPSRSCELETFLNLMKAKSFADYQKAITGFPYPAQNFVFASNTNDIALTVQGDMPIKGNQQGRFIMDGTNSSNAWKGFLPSQLNPQTINPTRGFVSSANQRTTDHTFPIYYNDGDFRQYRGEMINRLLAKHNKWTVEEMQTLQLNSYSPKAERLVPFLVKVTDTMQLQSKAREIVDAIKKWDYVYDSTSIVPVYFNVWLESIHKLTWDECTRIKHAEFPDDLTTLELIKNEPRSYAFDLQSTSQNEYAYDIIKMALDTTSRRLEVIEAKHKNWSEYKHARIAHIAQIPAFGKMYVTSSGHEDLINAHARVWGPSWRMIVELTKDGPTALGIYPGGQSGNPASKYYDNMIADWAKGKHYNLQFVNDISEIKQTIAQFKFN